jgi:hypothetical protein
MNSVTRAEEMKKITRYWLKWPAVCTAAAMSWIAIANDVEAGVGKRCTVDFAKSTIASADPMGVCNCEVVTLGFVRYIQTRDDYADILKVAGSQCQSLAEVLTETPVAAIFNNRYIASDPNGAARGSCSESQCGNEQQTAQSVAQPEPEPRPDPKPEPKPDPKPEPKPEPEPEPKPRPLP